MKVLTIPAWYPTAKLPIAGIFVKEQVHDLFAHGIGVSVIYSDTSYKYLSLPKINKINDKGIDTYVRSGFSLPKINTYFLNLWAKQYYQLYLKYEHDHGQPDIIHAHSFIGGYAGAYIKAKIKKPLLLTEHHTIPIEKTPNKRYYGICKTVYKQCDYIIAVSGELERGIEAIVETPVQTVFNSVDTKLFYPSRVVRDIKKQFRILGIGGYQANKGFDVLIKAIYQVRQNCPNVPIRLDLYGEGELEGRYRKMINELNLEGVVTVNGLAFREEVPNIMRKADLFCLPSYIEPFGMVLIEALATGIPILATGKGGPESIVNPNNGLWSAPGNVEELAKNIVTVYRNYDSYKEETLLEEVKSLYDKPRIVEQIIAIYTKLLS